MPKITFDSRLNTKRKEYANKYDIADLTTGNDKANLETLLRNEVLVEDLQFALQEKIEAGAVANIAEIKKLNDALRDLTNTNLSLEKALGIDRATRKKDISTDSPAEYIAKLKIMARDFLEKRLIKVTCPDCNILVMRFSPLVDHTKFEIKCECSQCHKTIKVHREARDILFDLPRNDKAWREKYKYQVEQPKPEAVDIIDAEEDELQIG